MNEPKIGVVTVTYNSAAFLGDFFASLDNQTYKNWFTYVIDNESKDSTVTDLQSRALNPAHYELIINPKNIGVAAGNNQGIKAALAAGCEYVLLLNNDTLFEANLFQKLVDACKQSGKRMSAPKMLYFSPSNTIWWGGGHFDKWRMYAGTHDAMDEIDVGQTNSTVNFDYCPTCCLLVHKSVFEEIGFMDERYFVYYDDTDFAIRANKAGINGSFISEVDFYHKVSGSTGGGESTFSITYMTRNRVYYIGKNLGLISLSYYSMFAPIVYSSRVVFRKINFSKYKILMKSHFQGLKMVLENSRFL